MPRRPPVWPAAVGRPDQRGHAAGRRPPAARAAHAGEPREAAARRSAAPSTATHLNDLITTLLALPLYDAALGPAK